MHIFFSVGLLLEFCVLATSKVISERVLTCDNAHLWQLYSVAAMEDQVTSIVTRYPTQSHYPGTEPTSLCRILIMPSARQGSDKYQF